MKIQTPEFGCVSLRQSLYPSRTNHDESPMVTGSEYRGSLFLRVLSSVADGEGKEVQAINSGKRRDRRSGNRTQKTGQHFLQD